MSTFGCRVEKFARIIFSCWRWAVELRGADLRLQGFEWSLVVGCWRWGRIAAEFDGFPRFTIFASLLLSDPLSVAIFGVGQEWISAQSSSYWTAISPSPKSPCNYSTFSLILSPWFAVIRCLCFGLLAYWVIESTIDPVSMLFHRQPKVTNL